MNNEEDMVQTLSKEEINTMKNEFSQEQENGNILEVQIEIFEIIMRDYAIELNTIQKDVKKKKKTKKKEKENRKLQDGSNKYENAIKKRT